MNLAEACRLTGVNRKSRENYQRGVPLSKSGEPLAEGVNNFSEISYTTKEGISVVRTSLEIYEGWDPTRFKRKLTMIISTVTGHLQAEYETYGHQAGTGMEKSGNWTDIYTMSHYPSRELRVRNGMPDDDQPLLLVNLRRSFVAPDGGVEYVDGNPGRRIAYMSPPSFR